MTAKKVVDRLIGEIKKSNGVESHQEWYDLWYEAELESDELEKLWTREGWNYITDFTQILSELQLSKSGVLELFFIVNEIASVSNREEICWKSPIYCFS